MSSDKKLSIIHSVHWTKFISHYWLSQTFLLKNSSFKFLISFFSLFYLYKKTELIQLDEIFSYSNSDNQANDNNSSNHSDGDAKHNKFFKK